MANGEVSLVDLRGDQMASGQSQGDIDAARCRGGVLVGEIEWRASEG